METKKVKELEPDDAIDLMGDEFADPNNDEAHLEDFWVIVDNIKQETPNCIRVDFGAYPAVAFPPDHEVRVRD
jgi:hypothetical protein